MTYTRPDVAAPGWLVQLLRTSPSPFPWSRSARAAVAMATPVAVSLFFGEIVIGSLVSIGALPTLLAESIGTYRYRARRLAGAVFAALVGFSIGMLSGSYPAVSFAVIVLIAAVSALISAAGSNASIAGLQLFVFTVVGSGQQALGADAGLAIGCFVAGASWGVLVGLSGWTVHATSPERDAVAQVYIELAAMLSATDEHTSRAARHQLTTAMNTAYDRLLTARSWLSGRDRTYRDLLNLLAAATPAVEAGVAMVNSGSRAPEEAADYPRAVASAVLAGKNPPPAPPVPAEGAAVALYAALGRIEAGTSRERKEPTAFTARLRQWGSSLVSGPLTWFAAARLTLCVTLAEVAALFVPFERAYWIPLTVGIVLKPDFGSVFGRAVLRGIGSVVGVAVGAVVLATTSETGVTAWILVLLIALFAAGIPFGKVRNYAILTAFVTPLIILEMEIGSAGGWPVVVARLVDSVLGCLIVLVFGYLLWPGSLRPRVGTRLAEMADTVIRYARSGLATVSTAEEAAERSRRRRRAYRGLADLRTAFQQAVVEPSAAGRQASAWWPAIVGLERTTDAVTEVVVSVRHGAPVPDPADVELIIAALSEFAAAVREQRAPRSVEMPRSEQLRGVADQLTLAMDAVRGPRVGGGFRWFPGRWRTRRATSE